MLTKVIGKRCQSAILLDGIEVECLLDSGSQVSTVSEGFYNRYLSSRPLESLQSAINIEGIGGHRLPYLGYVSVPVQFPGSPTTESQPKECLFLVCPDTGFSEKVPVLVGTNILCGLWPDSVPLWTRAEVQQVYAAVIETDKFCDRDTGRIGSVKLSGHRNVTIAPGETMSVSGMVRTSLTRTPYPAVVQEPIMSRNFPGGLLVKNALVTMPEMGRSRVNVEITNVSPKSVLLQPKAIIAELYIPEWTRSVGKTKPTVSAKSANASTDQSQRYQEGEMHSNDGKSFSDSDSKFLDKFKIDSGLSPEWQLRAKKLLVEYRDIFSEHDMDIGCTDEIEHRIDLTTDVPFRERSRPIRHADLNDARRHIQQLLEQQIIRESHSPYASPIVLVRKKNGDIRLTVDYRKLNRITVKDAHSLPRVEDAFTSLSGSRWFSTMDLKSGYYNIKVKESDKPKTAFTCPLGFYEWNRMPQGVTNAPATFQRLMEKCLGGMNLEWALAFLDDLIIFSKTLDEHEQRLRFAFQRLREFGLKLSPEKCHFFQRSVKYLGHVVSECGVHTDPSKVSAVTTWPRPENMKELRSLLGFLGYYRRFIKDFAKISSPLNQLLAGYTHQSSKGSKKKLSINHAMIKKPFGQAWTQDHETAFQALKIAITSAPVLAIADPNIPYELHTDASRSGLGAALYQKHDGLLRPVAFASRGLSKTEKNYPAHKLEFLALKWAVTEKLSDYLYGGHFKVLTDNNPLTYVMTTARLDATTQRWVAALSNYDFKIQYISGKKNVDADGLSRRPQDDYMPESDDDFDQDQATRQLLGRVETRQVLSSTLQVAEEPAVVSLAMQASAVSDLEYDPWAIPIVAVRKEEIAEAQSSDETVGRARQLLISGNKFRSRTETPPVRSLLRNYQTFVMSEGLLYKLSKFSGVSYKRLVIPQSLKSRVLNGIHNDMGHLGSDRALSIARTRFYWVNMDDDILRHCKECRNCLLRKGNNRHPAPLCKLQSVGPMDLVCIDFVSVDADASGKEHILVVTDHFTRYARAFVTRRQTAKEVAEMLWKNFFLDFGFPRRLHSDRGACFTGKLISQLKQITGVQSSFTTPYHPQGNGQCERFNRTLMGMLGTLDEKKKSSWSKHAKFLVHAYNCTQNDSTGFSPFQLMFGRQPRLPVDWYFGMDPEPVEAKPYDTYVRELKAGLEEAYKLASSKSSDSHEVNRIRYNQKVRRADLNIGDRVLVRNVQIRGRHKLANMWCPDVYIVRSRKGNSDSPVYSVQREDGKGVERVLHRNLLLPCGFLPLAESRLSDAQDLPVSQPRPVPRPRLPRRRVEKAVVNDSEDEDVCVEGEGVVEPETGDSDSDTDSDDMPVQAIADLGPPPPPLRRSTRIRKPPDRLQYNW